MLPIGETLKVLLLHFAPETPFLCESAMPFAAYAVTLGVVVLLGVGELFLVICLGLAGAERFGDREHNSFTRSTVPGRQQSPSGFLPIHSDWSLGRPELQLAQMTSSPFRSLEMSLLWV